MKNFSLLFLPAVSVIFLACEDSRGIRTYRIPKENKRWELTWKKPVSWQELPATGLRVASFALFDKQGGAVDISVIFLRGKAGGDLANVNRWRAQLSLPPWSSEDLAANLMKEECAAGKFKFVELAADSSCIMAAILPVTDGTWFFKMSGDRELTLAQRDSFLQFVKSAGFSDRK